MYTKNTCTPYLPDEFYPWLMRISVTAFILLAMLLHISAKGVAQRVTIAERTLTLREALNEINRQTGYHFAWSAQKVSSRTQVTVDIVDQPITKALDMLLIGFPLAYVLEDQVVIIKEKPTSSVISSERSDENPEGLIGDKSPNSEGLIPAFQQSTGRIVDSVGNPLAGASIRVLNAEGRRTSLQTTSDRNGEFFLRNVPEDAMLEISYMGHVTMKVKAAANLGSIVLSELSSELEEVLVSTGYQTIPKERATGSFVQIDRELINRKVSTNLLDRLEDVTPSLIFNRGNGASNDPISIRGRNTLFAETQPLIVVDNFPYDGPIENINPNDVESITVLRDAAAASIWGAQSGNGVIVIKTKSGGFKTPLRVTVNSNVNFVEKPDLFARPLMDIGEFVGVEEFLFNNGNYDARINQAGRPALSPVVETLLTFREGRISESEKNSALARFQTYDSRSALTRDFYRTAANQQYSVGLNGGTDQNRYSVGLGFDQNRHSIPGNSNSRYTASLQNDWKSNNGRLDLGVAVYWGQSENETGTEIPDMLPYERLRDESGIPLQVMKDFSIRYLSQFQELGYLDGTYVPLNEIGLSSNNTRQVDSRFNLSMGYSMAPWIKATVRYQYWANSGESRHHQPLESYNTRWLINRYTQASPEGIFTYPVPVGGVLNQSNTNSSGQYLRGQINIDKTWREQHEIHGILGAELKNVTQLSSGVRYYGYDDEFGLSLPVDYLTRFRINPTNSLNTVPNGDSHSGTLDRFVSMFSNMSYIYKKRYILTASARKDASNLFGVNTNQRAVPLWSAGAAWTVSQERFYNSGLIPYLKLRTTFGYNGNVDRTLSAYTTANYYATGSNTLNPGEKAATIRNPPNPNLRWERIKIWNAALDFGFKNDLLDGSLEFYSKNGDDLIGDIPLAPSMGITQFRGNFAATLTRGMDLELRSSPIKGQLRWDINYFHSFVKEEVTDFEITPRADNMVFGLLLTPVKGRPLFSVYSFPWGGLDPDSGAPRGILDGEPSMDYSAILANLTPENVVFHGSARPTSFGSLRNTMSFKGLSLSVNISYRLGYYFKRNSVDYTDLVNGRITHSDYHLRWQQPGDEAETQVPSMPLTVNANRHNLYSASEIMVERGDHVRLQDIRLAYQLDRGHIRWLPFRSAEFYTYANNLGILWKKTKYSIDPDFQNMPQASSFAVGLRIDL